MNPRFWLLLGLMLFRLLFIQYVAGQADPTITTEATPSAIVISAEPQPFAIELDLALGPGEWHVRAVVLNDGGKVGNKMMVDDQWTYPYTSWSRLPVAEPGSNWLELRMEPDYLGYPAIGDDVRLRISAKEMGSGTILDHDTPLTVIAGHSISGRAGNYTESASGILHVMGAEGVFHTRMAGGSYGIAVPSGDFVVSTSSDQNWSDEWIVDSDLGRDLFMGERPQLELHELMINPEGSDNNREWIELVNRGSEIVNLIGWSVDDLDGSGVDFTFPNWNLVGGGLVVASGANSSLGDVNWNRSAWLGNQGDDLVLRDPWGEISDEIGWGEGPERDGIDGIPDVPPMNQSLSSSNGTWTWTEPSPGSPNGAPVLPTLSDLHSFQVHGCEPMGLSLSFSSTTFLDLDVVIDHPRWEVQSWNHSPPIIELELSPKSVCIPADLVRVDVVSAGVTRSHQVTVWDPSVEFPLVSGVLVNGPEMREDAEMVTIQNPNEHAINLAGWRLTDHEISFGFPSLALPPGSTNVSRNTSLHEVLSGQVAELECLDPCWNLANAADEIALIDPNNNEVDCVVWGTGSCVGWQGPGIETPLVNQVLRRTGGDANWSGDWNDRPYLIGTTDLRPSWSNNIVEVIQTPQGSLARTLEFIANASRSIMISCYQFTSLELGQALLEAIGRGVMVDMVIEGNPVGFDLSSGGEEVQTEKWILGRLHDAGATIQFMANSGLGVRFPYLHAKVMVADEAYTLVSSENFKPNGFATEGSGNRGWLGIVSGTELANDFLAWMEADREGYDLIPFQPSHPRWGDASVSLSWPDGILAASGPSARAPAPVLAVVGPDNSFASGSILDVLGAAETSIDISLASLDPTWGDQISPLYGAIVEANRRGVAVRVLLDPTYAVPGSSTWEAESMLDAEGVDVRWFNSPGTIKLHNKGMLVDGRFSLVSSLNWGYYGFQRNREAGLLIDSAEIATFLTTGFEADWATSGPTEQTNPSVLEATNESDLAGSLSWMVLGSLGIAGVLLFCIMRLSRRAHGGRVDTP